MLTRTIRSSGRPEETITTKDTKDTKKAQRFQQETTRRNGFTTEDTEDEGSMPIDTNKPRATMRSASNTSFELPAAAAAKRRARSESPSLCVLCVLSGEVFLRRPLVPS